MKVGGGEEWMERPSPVSDSASLSTSSAKAKTKRRATVGGSRLSLHSLLFPSSSNAKEKEKLSRSANDLQGKSGEWGGVEEQKGSPPTKQKMKECPLCFLRLPATNFPRLSCCSHRSCHSCLVQYLQLEILESRVVISCPECSEMLHPNDIYALLAELPHLILKYEEFSLRRVLMADQDTRWCPAPDCNYAVIASGCAGCPELRCERPGCGTLFCYHCKMVWHPNATCDEARAQRGSFATSPIHMDSSIRPGDIKACPRCRTYIVKMNDGSCNHMICAICGAEFCWLCLKEISDLHYLSPSGCTFWGKKPWSRKKKLMWQVGTLIGAPVGIALVAGLAVPAIIFGVPVFVGRKVYQRLREKPSKARRRVAIAGSVVGSFLISPVLATMAVGVGVPIMLAYVYGVVPLSLCRNGTCGVSASSSGVRLDVDEDIIVSMTGQGEGQERAHLLKEDGKGADGMTVGGMSIQSGSSIGGGNPNRLQIQADVCGRRRGSMESGAASNYEEASTKAMAGSTYYDDKSVHTMGSLQEGGSYCEEEASVRALAGSVVETKSIYGGASDSASVRAMAGSIGPDSLSGRHVVSVDNHIHQTRSERGSPAPLLEEDISDAEGETSTARLRMSDAHHDHHHHHGSESWRQDGEFLLFSPDAFHQLHPTVPIPKKARSVSLLLETSPGELWQLLSDSPTQPWTVLERVRSRGATLGSVSGFRSSGAPLRTTTKASGSYTSLPDANKSRPSASRLFLSKLRRSKDQPPPSDRR